MLHIKCPYCGLRSQKEFSYGGDANVKRPKLNVEVTDTEWDDFVYMRKSPRGHHLELWHHTSGCRQWIKVKRDTIDHNLLKEGYQIGVRSPEEFLRLNSNLFY